MQHLTYVFDKGYCDYNWWFQFTVNEAFFVTRFKKNAGLRTLKEKAIPNEHTEIILRDEVVEFKNRRPGGNRINQHHGTPLRRISVNRERKEPLILATNDMEKSAKEVADLYKKRWDIELFFKWLKQNLRIKQFLGRTENAVRLQIYIAIITYLLVFIYRRKHGTGASLRLCLATLKSGLFQRPELEDEIIRRRHFEKSQSQILQGNLAL